MTVADDRGAAGRAGRVWWLGLSLLVTVAVVGGGKYLWKREPPAPPPSHPPPVRPVSDGRTSGSKPEHLTPVSAAGELDTAVALAQRPPRKPAKAKPTLTKFLASHETPGLADPQAVERERQWQQQIRDTAAAWVTSGKMQTLMNAQTPKILLTNGPLSSVDLCVIAEELLGAVGLPAEAASAACRETAFAHAALGIERVRRADEDFLKAVASVQDSKEHQRLRESLLAGFDGLSQPHALLDEAHLKQLARREVDKAFASQPAPVRERVAQALANDLIGRANAAWNELSLFVRTIFFGHPDFGTRETFLVHDSFEARQKAMEQRILAVISKNPKYQKAILDPADVPGVEGVRSDRHVKQLVRQHAAQLAETIRGVPTIKP